MAAPQTSRDSRLIEVEAIIVAYAMSRLNEVFLARFRFKSWRAAFAATGAALDVPPTSMKNLRDEFDPLHGFRKGWHKRPLRNNRQRVLAEFCDISDDALLEVVDGLLRKDAETSAAVVEPLAFATARIEDVAKRLRTGRLAEEYFLAHSRKICGIKPGDLVDRRDEAAGFDFGVATQPELAIEVKGLRKAKGDILFTDREWRTARARREAFWLVVVGGLDDAPLARIWKDPCKALSPTSQAVRSLAVTWRASVSVA